MSHEASAPAAVARLRRDVEALCVTPRHRDVPRSLCNQWGVEAVRAYTPAGRGRVLGHEHTAHLRRGADRGPEHAGVRHCCRSFGVNPTGVQGTPASSRAVRSRTTDQRRPQYAGVRKGEVRTGVDTEAGKVGRETRTK